MIHGRWYISLYIIYESTAPSPCLLKSFFIDSVILVTGNLSQHIRYPKYVTVTGCHNESISQCHTVILDMCADHRNHQIDWIARKCDWCDGRIWNELMSQSKVDRVAPHHGRLTTPLPIHRFSKLRTREVRPWKGSTPGSLLAQLIHNFAINLLGFSFLQICTSLP